MPNGTIERKCMKGHKKTEGRCSPRCVRWYPRVQRAASDGHGRRRFDYLGGYPTKAAARAGVAAFIDEYNRDRRHSALGMTSPISYELSQQQDAGPEEAA